MKLGAKILSTVILVVLIVGLSFLTFYSNKEKPKEYISSVSIKNYNLLSENDYLRFARLDNELTMSYVTLPILKDRIEKHPYINKADIELTDSKKAQIYVEEKKIKALIQKDNDAYYITDKYEILPVFANTNLMDIPLITNVKTLENFEVKEIYCNDEIKEAFRIIDGLKHLDYDLYKSLNQINLRGGSDILLNFNCFNAPVIFGKGDDARKTVYLESLFKNYNNQLLDSINYIDLRYSKLIFVGKMNG
jgi:Cell division septal protein